LPLLTCYRRIGVVVVVEKEEEEEEEEDDDDDDDDDAFNQRLICNSAIRISNRDKVDAVSKTCPS
jgi:hypothetical protein